LDLLVCATSYQPADNFAGFVDATRANLDSAGDQRYLVGDARANGVGGGLRVGEIMPLKIEGHIHQRDHRGGFQERPADGGDCGAGVDAECGNRRVTQASIDWFLQMPHARFVGVGISLAAQGFPVKILSVATFCKRAATHRSYGACFRSYVCLVYRADGNPQSLNLYAYVGNNPVSTVDPDGHAELADEQAYDPATSVQTDVGSEWSPEDGTSSYDVDGASTTENANISQNQGQAQNTVTVEQVQGQGANVADHAAITVNGQQAVGLEQKKDSATAAIEDKTTPGAVKPVDPSRTVKDKAVIPVTPEQAAKIQKFLDNAKQNPPNYNLYHSNCAQFCERALQAGGVKNVPNDVTPKGLVNDLNHAPSFVDYLRMVPVGPFF
jgi:hypothetical protein